MHIAVLVGNESDPGQVILAALGGQSAPEAFSSVTPDDRMEVTLISWSAPSKPLEGVRSTPPLSEASDPLLDKILNRQPLRSLVALSRSSALGRLVLSMSPADQGRVFWRRMKAQPSLRRILRESDVLVAADYPATRVCWHSVKTISGQRAYFGIQSAITMLEASHAQSTKR